MPKEHISDCPTDSMGSMSRRTCLCGAALVAGLGVPLFEITSVHAEDRAEAAKKKNDDKKAAEAKKKVSKEQAAYQDQPKGKENLCATCKYFAAPSSCVLVDGMVSPQGWCQLYEKKSV